MGRAQKPVFVYFTGSVRQRDACRGGKNLTTLFLTTSSKYASGWGVC
ncbi:hypothetical protein IWX85_002583 [Polaromonas sp. CG_9.11]|nr:hypothetical protein [Polaromonas sp. CG_9.11]